MNKKLNIPEEIANMNFLEALDRQSNPFIKLFLKQILGDDQLNFPLSAIIKMIEENGDEELLNLVQEIIDNNMSSKENIALANECIDKLNAYKEQTKIDLEDE